MSSYTLVDSAGNIVSGHERKPHVAPPDPVAGKGWRWVADSPPVVARHQQARRQVPVSAGATSVDYEVVDRPLAEVQRERCLEIDRVARTRLDAGAAFEGRTFDADTRSLDYISSVATGIAGGQGLPGGAATIGWWDRHNVPLEMDQAGFLAFAAAVRDQVFAIRRTARAKKDAVMAATTAADVAAMDPEADWPEFG